MASKNKLKTEPSMMEVALFYNSSKEARKVAKLQLLNLFLAPVIFIILGVNFWSVLAYLLLASHIIFNTLKTIYTLNNKRENLQGKVGEVLDNILPKIK